MREIRGSVDIDVPLERVWQVVTDFRAYPEWNPWITRMEGESKVGSRIGVTVKAPGRKDTNFVSEVIEIKPNREMLMRGTVLKGMLGDDHWFKFEAVGENQTRFFQSVVFKGALSPMIGSLVRDHQKGLDLMNQAMRKLCEGAMKS